MLFAVFKKPRFQVSNQGASIPGRIDAISNNAAALIVDRRRRRAYDAENVSDKASHSTRQYTLEEYLALERESETKYEFWDGEIHPISGGSLAHDQIMGNVDRLIARQLEGKPCTVFTNNMQIKLPRGGPYRYADGSVVCGNLKVEPYNGSDLLVNPVVIWDVLSSSTEAFDRGDKFTFYKSIESFKEYLVIAQRRCHITHYSRLDDGKWDYEEANDLDARIVLREIDCVLSLSDVYRNVELNG